MFNTVAVGLAHKCNIHKRHEATAARLQASGERKNSTGRELPAGARALYASSARVRREDRPLSFLSASYFEVQRKRTNQAPSLKYGICASLPAQLLEMVFVNTAGVFSLPSERAPICVPHTRWEGLFVFSRFSLEGVRLMVIAFLLREMKGVPRASCPTGVIRVEFSFTSTATRCIVKSTVEGSGCYRATPCASCFPPNVTA